MRGFTSSLIFNTCTRNGVSTGPSARREALDRAMRSLEARLTVLPRREFINPVGVHGVEVGGTMCHWWWLVTGIHTRSPHRHPSH
jgi:hypothetical protein